MRHRDKVELHTQPGEPAQKGVEKEGADEGSWKICLSCLESCGPQKTGRKHEKQDLLARVHDRSANAQGFDVASKGKNETGNHKNQKFQKVSPNPYLRDSIDILSQGLYVLPSPRLCLQKPAECK